MGAVTAPPPHPAAHGVPGQLGPPDYVGITDSSHPDFGDAVGVKDDEEPGFWACGVTPQAVALNGKPSLMITHAPGRMFITDVRDADYAVL